MAFSYRHSNLLKINTEFIVHTRQLQHTSQIASPVDPEVTVLGKVTNNQLLKLQHEMDEKCR